MNRTPRQGRQSRQVGPTPVTAPAPTTAPASTVTAAVLTSAPMLPPTVYRFGQNPTVTGGIAAAGAPPSFTNSHSTSTTTSGVPTTAKVPLYKQFWNYITNEGPAKVLIIFSVLVAIMSLILGWYYWDDMIAAWPTWAAFGSRLLWLSIGVIFFALLVYKKTWKLTWLTVIMLIGGWLVIWGVCLLLKWAFIPTSKIVSIRDLGINPITAWIGDMSEGRDVRSPDSSLVSTDTPASPAPPCEPQFKKVAIKRGETFLICNRGPGRKVESYTVWRLDQGDEPLRFKMNGPSGGMEDATLEQVTAKFAIATEVHEKGPVEAEQPVGDVYRHFGLPEGTRARLTSRGTRSTQQAEPAVEAPLDPSLFPRDKNGVPIPPLPGEEGVPSQVGTPDNNVLLTVPVPEGSVALAPPTDLVADETMAR